ncbi:MAG: Maf family protein [Mariprofundus sp.]
MRLILASTSPYRKELLNRLRLPFEQISPDFEEIRPGSKPPTELVQCNTLGKARSVLATHPQATVIASDQVAVCEDIVLGKPHDIETERPLDCAGSFKSEGLGICLFERMQGDDPSALIGLPLIRLSQWLQPLSRL